MKAVSLRRHQCVFRTARLAARGLIFLAFLTGRALTAQATSPTFNWGVTGGAAFFTASLQGHLSKIGPAASVFVRWSAAPRLALTAEILATHFGLSVDHVHGSCGFETDPFACHPPVGPVTVGALAAGLQWADSTVAVGQRGSYLLLGGGLYRALRHPSAAGATRLGWTAGFGFLLRPTSPRLALEVRYHQIPRWPEDRVSLIPLALALSW